MKMIKPRWLNLLFLGIMLSGAYPAHAYYDPGEQRWLNRDPIGEAGGENLYVALKNEPLATTDPLGLDVGGGGPYEPTPAPVFDPNKWHDENCMAYALNRPCNQQMFPKIGSENTYNDCSALINGIKDTYGAIAPTLGKCPEGWHKIRVYPGFHVQRQDGDGKWSEKNFQFKARRCATDSSGDPVDRPQDPGMKPAKPCKNGYLCVPN